ncbi:hypothetical protein LCGC14_1175000 [marine sediment metagenome]|uniref:Uncharacterized protein n=1 Tax=marine sediment metagenome TaxID=412755 RepID=A0A0F9P6S8_9ZZZZ|nr:hypothetical protein [bacterium]
MTSNKIEKKVRDKIVHIAFSEDEKNEIKDFADISGTTSSEWIRQSIRERIRRIKNPESNQSQYSPELLKKISADTQKILELQREKENRIEIYENLLETSEAIQDEYKRLKEKGLMADLSEEQEIIKKLLTGHKSLTPKQISDMTKIESNKVSFIITNRDFFKLNITTGRYSKR